MDNSAKTTVFARGRKRPHPVVVAYSADELQILRDRRALTGQTQSDFARDAALGRPLTVSSLAIVRQLREIEQEQRRISPEAADLLRMLLSDLGL